ncbi:MULTISPECIES: cold-shock protein [Micromonospora]|uniref:cold-shock protein n=1 Tax=Micromonospora TaxID=1873 RepID=UPI0021C628F6|nr:cold shock domain-containing protein [Micromonospora sp. Mcm103]
MSSVGKIIRFDDVRGYGFIAPTGGGDDVFFHANDFGEQRQLVRIGLPIEYDVIDGDRGLRARSVRVLETTETPHASTNGDEIRSRVRTDGDEEMCDVLASAEFVGAVTEMLLQCAPSLTGSQIIEVRKRFIEFSRSHGWVDG